MSRGTWKGKSLFSPAANEVLSAAGDKSAALRLREGEQILWLGRACGLHAPLAYYPTTAWTVFIGGVLWVVLLGIWGGTAPNANVVGFYLLLISFVAVMIFFVLANAYAYWRHTGRHDLYLITSQRVIFSMSSGRYVFPWGGVLFDAPARRAAIKRNGSDAFDLELDELAAVEIRKLPKADVGNIYFPGWADDRNLGSHKVGLFVFDELAAKLAPSGVVVRTLLRIGPRRRFRPSAMFAVEHVSHVGELLSSLIDASSRAQAEQKSSA